MARSWMSQLEESARLQYQQYKEKIRFMEMPEEFQDISSTAMWRNFVKGRSLFHESFEEVEAF